MLCELPARSGSFSSLIENSTAKDMRRAKNLLAIVGVALLHLCALTICISIKVPDGLVMAADSLSSYTVFNPNTQGWDVVQSYSYSNKLIQFGSASIGTLAWGIGSIQRRSIQNLIEQFSRDHIPPGYTPTVQAISKELSGY